METWLYCGNNSEHLWLEQTPEAQSELSEHQLPNEPLLIVNLNKKKNCSPKI